MVMRSNLDSTWCNHVIRTLVYLIHYELQTDYNCHDEWFFSSLRHIVLSLAVYTVSYRHRALTCHVRPFNPRNAAICLVCLVDGGPIELKQSGWPLLNPIASMTLPLDKYVMAWDQKRMVTSLSLSDSKNVLNNDGSVQYEQYSRWCDHRCSTT